MSSPSSSVQQAREALGQRLREIRKQSGLTARELAGRAGWHESKCSRIENGRTAPSDADIRAWTTHCDAQDQETDLIATARGIEGMYVEWCRKEGAGLRRVQEAATPLYERTRQFRAYSSWLMPGLLQTAGYSRAVLHAVARRRRLRTDDIEEAVALRTRRQSVLQEGDHQFAFVVEESVLRTVIGGADVMAAQLAHLIVAASLPSVSLGIIPAGADRTAMRPVESFWIFDSAQVKVELVSAHLTITQPREVVLYEQTLQALREFAVYGAEARSLITSAIDALS